MKRFLKSFLKKLVLTLLIAVLPLQGIAAMVMPMCQQEPAASALDVAAHAHTGGYDHAHEATVPDHDRPLAAGDFGSDHCSTASAFAIPVIATTLAAESGSERSLFLATSVSGHIPEQPQRPPRV